MEAETPKEPYHPFDSEEDLDQEVENEKISHISRGYDISGYSAMPGRRGSSKSTFATWGSRRQRQFSQAGSSNRMCFFSASLTASITATAQKKKGSEVVCSM